MSFNAAEYLAREFAAANSETVTLCLDGGEREMLDKGWSQVSRFYHDQLLEYGPTFALIRQWRGLRQRFRFSEKRSRGCRTSYEMQCTSFEHRVPISRQSRSSGRCEADEQQNPS